MIVLRFIASIFYTIVVGLRNFLYDEKILRSATVGIPTICIGNLAVGGTGKTPHTEHIARELSKQYKVAVLSLGYKRKSRGFFLADENSTAELIGDEPMQLHSNLPEVAVAVCKDRVNGIKKLKEKIPDLQLVILDDAFQYRKLKCDINILLTQQSNLYIDDHMLPYGLLRDQKNQSLRANVIMVTNCDHTMQPIEQRVIRTKLKMPSYQQLFFSEQHYQDLVPVKKSSSITIKYPLIVCGIANPKGMIEYLKEQYPNAKVLVFNDHQRYGNRTIKRIINTYNANNCDSIITTNKDFVKLQSSESFKPLIDCTYYLPLRINILNEKNLLDIIHIKYKELTGGKTGKYQRAVPK